MSKLEEYNIAIDTLAKAMLKKKLADDECKKAEENLVALIVELKKEVQALNEIQEMMKLL